VRRHAWASEADHAAARHAGERPVHHTERDPDAEPGGLARSVLGLQRVAGNAAVVAALAGTSVQRAPDPTKDKPKQAPKPKAQPQWARDAEAKLKQLFKDDPLIAKVVIKDYAGANQELQTVDYGAWTQSQTEIYVRDPSIDKATKQRRPKNIAAMVLTYVLKHEAVHVRQFAGAGGPPATWHKMLEYELAAYASDKAWLATDEGPKVITDQGTLDQFEEAADKYVIKIGALLEEAKTFKATEREAKLHEKMKAANLIPAGASLDPRDLYKQPP
jgi:hypothetical protein